MSVKEAEYMNGPSIVLNGGSISDHAISSRDKYGRYSMKYTVGVGNRSWIELRNICLDLLPEATKHPWRINESTNMVSISAWSSKRPDILDSEGRRISSNKVFSGAFCRVNLRPTAYIRQEVSQYVDPFTFETITEPFVNKGITLMLNGIKLIDQDIDNLF